MLEFDSTRPQRHGVGRVFTGEGVVADELESQYVVAGQELRRKSQASAEGVLNIGGLRRHWQAGDQSAIQQYIQMAELCEQTRRKGVVEIELCLLRNLCL